jgi:hypothetical protein
VTNPQRLIFGLREMPRPVGEGYLYYKFSDREEDRILVFLDLLKTSEAELEVLFRRSILELITREKLAQPELQILLSAYTTRNMRPWTEQVLSRIARIITNTGSSTQNAETNSLLTKSS